MNLGKAIAHALRSGALALVRLCGWVDRLTALHVQVRPLAGLPSLATLLAVLRCQVGPLAGFCSRFWLGRVASRVSWHGGAPGWIERLGMDAGCVVQSLLVGWGLGLCPSTSWCHWRDPLSGGSPGRAWVGRGSQNVLCAEGHSLGLLSRRPLAVLWCWGDSCYNLWGGTIQIMFSPNSSPTPTPPD